MDSTTTNTDQTKKIVIGLLFCAVVGFIIYVIVTKNDKKTFTVNVNEEDNTTTTTKEDNTTTTTTEDPPTSTVVEEEKKMNVTQISNEYILENYKKPMLKHKELNVIEHGNFVILQETSDILKHLQLNAVMTSMYFPNLHVYVVRGIYGESIVNCFVDAKTLEFVRVASDYTGDSVLQSSGKKQKPNEPLLEILKYDDSKKYFPASLQQMIIDQSDSFYKRTTINTYGVDSKRLY